MSRDARGVGFIDCSALSRVMPKGRYRLLKHTREGYIYRYDPGEDREMAERHASEQVPQDVEKIQAQVAQLRSTLRELGQTLLEWGQRGVDDTRQELQAHAQDLGDAINDTVEGARRRGSQVVGEALSQTIEAAQT
jgi:hypothetical protein